MTFQKILNIQLICGNVTPANCSVTHKCTPRPTFSQFWENYNITKTNRGNIIKVKGTNYGQKYCEPITRPGVLL